MFSLTDIAVDFQTGTPVLAWLALIVLIALSIYLYRRTNPPLPVWLRLILGVLRAGAVIVLMALLLEPVISYSSEFERSRRVSILVDHSLSMDREEIGSTRAARVDSLLNTPDFRQLSDQLSVSRYHFGAELQASPNEVNRDKTAIGDALYELDQQEIAQPADYWLLLSDGRSNAGREPPTVVPGLTTPVVTVDMAIDVGNFDLRLADVSFNPVQFVGQQGEIDVRLNWHNAAGREALVELREGNRTLTQRRLSIEEEGGFGDLTLDYTPTDPGQKLLEVAIVPLEGEETTDNNARTISMKVLKSRLLVLLVSAEPDYEIGFLKRFLDNSDKYDVDLVVTAGSAGNLSGRIPDRQTELNRYDLIVLHDPDPLRLESRRPLLQSYLADKGGGLWVMMGERFAARGPVDWFNAWLPFYQSARRSIEYTEFQGEPVEGQLFHPAVRLADSRAAIRETWANLPPFAALVPADSADPNGVILANVASGNRWSRFPILGYKRIGPGKVIASAAGPFWRWSFVTRGLGEPSDNYDKFVEGVTSWLTITEDFDPVRIGPEKQVFTRGEPVRFDGFASDLGFRPIPGATGSVSLTGENETDQFEADLIELGDGRYRAEFTGVPPGTYQWEGRLEKDGRELKESEGVIQVESFSLEEFDQSGDPQTLRTIAQLSGGSYHTFREFDEALRTIETEQVVETVQGEFTLFNKMWLLLLFVGLLSVEWLLRKLNHLV
ncbi:hypothetical protein GF420_11475 [candidate division GN15 bacterium]|nr:hypothetical protein [candidate division GN15 bacterium]